LVTGVGERTDRPPVRARSGRRPLPPIIFLLVLAVAALGVWWNVLQKDADRQADQAAACSSASAAAPSLDPTTVHLRVLNGSDQQGVAGQVAAALQQLGLIVDEIGNDGSGREVTGVGEVRHGRDADGAGAARYVALYVPGATDYTDTRATSQVDLVIGPDFRFPDDLASAADVENSLAAAASAESAC
jgi:LytR cell envelope-related transcriptional attenuator